jgi:hypothetical protein
MTDYYADRAAAQLEHTTIAFLESKGETVNQHGNLIAEKIVDPATDGRMFDLSRYIGQPQKADADVALSDDTPLDEAAALFSTAAVLLAIHAPASFAGVADLPDKAKLATDLSSFTSVDNRLTLSYIFEGTGPGHWSRNPDGSINGKTGKQLYLFTHFDAWTYGTNVFAISMYKSENNDPAAPCTGPGTVTDPLGTHPFATVSANCHGAIEIYGLFRSTFGWNEIFNTKAFTMGPLHNISFEVGMDANYENDYNSAAKRLVVAGLQFAFDLPYKSLFTVAPLMHYEFSNHSGFLRCGAGWNLPAPTIPGMTCTPDGNKSYKPTWAIEMSSSMDLGFLPEDMQYYSVSSRAAFYGPKGNQYAPLGIASGGSATKLEINAEPIRLTFDAGKAFAGTKYSHFVDVWVAYRFWQNKYGLDASASPTCFTKIPGQSNNSCTESSLFSGITVKF